MVEIDGIPTNILLAAGYKTISDTANYEDGSKQVPIDDASSSLIDVRIGLGVESKTLTAKFNGNFYGFHPAGVVS